MKLKTLKTIIIIFIIFIILPIIIYIANFWGMTLSESPEKWGAFGDYFGGLLNPVIAIFGTIFLGYLTYEIGKQNSNDTKNIFVYQQRMIAYQEIADLTTELDASRNKIKIHNDLMIALGKQGVKEETVNQYIKAMESTFFPISNLKVSLYNFPIKYGHLFKYDFDSTHYRNLKEKSSKLYNSLDILERKEREKIDFNDTELISEFKTFLGDLREEINTL
ncbi:hypothetical protein [Olleya marilimosa]|uniref:hypothetical protein n=1 Tax=Olleya marilimosa TaxID=272164 RepID=UPI0030ED1053|tara:strand:- start:150265 stop:150924 length:660 start_codon:yes stop_codon:yes gene_type:complete